jgi:hypothetical protein
MATSPSSMHVCRCAWALALAAGCNPITDFSGALDKPGPLGLLPGDSGPFGAPVVYAADEHGGRIRVLDVELGRYVADDPYAAFYRSSGIGTGAARVIAALAPIAPDPDHAWVWAIDRAHDALLKVPHVAGRDAGGFLYEPVPVLAPGPHVDADGSGDLASFGSYAAQQGVAGTETFTLTFRAGALDVVGSRSGRQAARAELGRLYRTADGAVTFSVVGTMSEGDSLTLSVDTGIVELPLEATPEDLVRAPDGSWLLLAMADGTLRWLDPTSGNELGRATLPEGAHPTRIEVTPDAVYVLDRGDDDADDGHRLWVLRPLATEAKALELPFPALDVAALEADGGRQLYVARADESEVWIWDLATDAWLDLNPWTPEVDGRRFLAPVRGVAAMNEAWPRLAEDGTATGPSARAVAVSLQSGRVVFMEETTGCLVPDLLGPRSDLSNQTLATADWKPNYALNPPQTAWLEATEDERRHVLVNACAGSAWTESWRMRFDAVQQGWVVEGDISGRLPGLVREDERYLAPNGAFSLVVRAGSQPTEDGWQIAFKLLEGAVSADGDTDKDGVRDLNFDLPGDPIVVYGRAGGVPTGTRRPWVLTAAQSADIVVRIKPETGELDRLWD